jgi:photosystem II stability/assembly factor-like uncharacterized protein
MGRFLEKSKGATFIQTDPADPFDFLTCVGVGNVAVPKRARSIKYEPDPTSAGDFKTAGFIKGEQGEATTTLTRPLDSVYNFLLELECPYQFRINHPCRGDRTIITNYEMAELIFDAAPTSGEVEEPVVLEPGDDDRILTNGEISGRDYVLIYPLDGEQQDNISTTTGANDIAFLPMRCADRCGPARGLGQIGYAALDSAGYLAADNVVYTLDYGAGWAPTAADPWGGSRDAMCVLLIELANGYRVVVGGGPDPGQDAEISYSDAVGNAEAGAAWNDVTVGTQNNQGINDLARDPLGRIYAAADVGMIYRSDDLALTWTLIESGTTAQNLNGVCWYSEQVGYAVGDSNAMLRTTDGGITWALITGPVVAQNLESVAVNHAGHVYVAVGNGTIWYSTDQGDNWTLRVTLCTGGSTNKIRFDPKLAYFGGAVCDTGAGAGYLHRSEDGGPSWDEQEYITNSGLNSLWVCDQNLIYVCGEPQGGITFIAQYHRAAS